MNQRTWEEIASETEDEALERACLLADHCENEQRKASALRLETAQYSAMHEFVYIFSKEFSNEECT